MADGYETIQKQYLIIVVPGKGLLLYLENKDHNSVKMLLGINDLP